MQRVIDAWQQQVREGAIAIQQVSSFNHMCVCALAQAAASKEELEIVTRTAGETRSKHAAAVQELAGVQAQRDSFELEARAAAKREAETRALLQQVSRTDERLAGWMQ